MHCISSLQLCQAPPPAAEDKTGTTSTRSVRSIVQREIPIAVVRHHAEDRNAPRRCSRWNVLPARSVTWRIFVTREWQIICRAAVSCREGDCLHTHKHFDAPGGGRREGVVREETRVLQPSPGPREIGIVACCALARARADNHYKSQEGSRAFLPSGPQQHRRCGARSFGGIRSKRLAVQGRSQCPELSLSSVTGHSS